MKFNKSIKCIHSKFAERSPLICIFHSVVIQSFSHSTNYFESFQNFCLIMKNFHWVRRLYLIIRSLCSSL